MTPLDQLLLCNIPKYWNLHQSSVHYILQDSLLLLSVLLNSRDQTTTPSVLLCHHHEMKCVNME